MATKIGSLFGDITINTKQLDKDLRRVNRKLKSFGRSASQAGKSMALGFGTPVAIMGGTAVKVFQNFEQEMAKVKAISGATASEFAMLEKNARDLGASTRFTATNVSELQLNFSKLGFTATEIEKVTKTFSLNNTKQEANLIDTLKSICKKYSRDKTGKKPLTNINLVRI